MATSLVSPNEVEKLVPQVVTQGQGITVRDADDYEMACTFLQLVATRKKQVEEAFDPIVRKAHETHKEAVAQKKKFMDPLLLAEADVKLKVGRWRQDEEIKRQAEERRLQAEERKRLEEVAMTTAAHLEASGEHDLAEMAIQEAVNAPAPVVILETMVPKIANIAGRKNWKFRVTDPLKVPREYLIVNESAIGAVVRAQKDLTKIPGVETYCDDSVSVRAIR